MLVSKFSQIVSELRSRGWRRHWNISEHRCGVRGVQDKILCQALLKKWEAALFQMKHLIHCKHPASAKLCNALLWQIQNPARGCHYNMNFLAEAHNIIFQACSSCGHKHFHAHVLPQLFAYLTGLESELPCWYKNECCTERRGSECHVPHSETLYHWQSSAEALLIVMPHYTGK